MASTAPAEDTAAGYATADAAREAAHAALGAAPDDLLESLVSGLSGAVLDAADALEVSARNAGAGAPEACTATTACVDALREQLAARLGALREYALLHVLSPPPANASAAPAAAPLPASEMQTCAKRLADARARTRALERASRAELRRVTRLEDIAAAAAPGATAARDQVGMLAAALKESRADEARTRDALDDKREEEGVPAMATPVDEGAWGLVARALGADGDNGEPAGVRPTTGSEFRVVEAMELVDTLRQGRR